MKFLDPGALAVIFLYAVTLAVILFVSPRLGQPMRPGPWWRSPRFWASFVAVVQIVVYAVWS